MLPWKPWESLCSDFLLNSSMHKQLVFSAPVCYLSLTIIIIVVVVVNIRKLLVKELEKRPKELKVFAAPIGGTTI